MTIETPSYFLYFGRTFVIDSTPDGGLAGSLLNWDTGEFEPANAPVQKALFATSDSDISPLDREQFVQRTERIRQQLTGDGPIFALYDTIDSIYDQAEAENRRLSDEEVELISSIQRRTFAMWEDELARRAAGEPPSFTVRRKNV
ncbi:hypothetical protein [Amycolatopsis albispora]|uniref:Uncharacterized protein n=1 Tax=Amycolatopsis albispora TaxID=1804986 RepID=A0A344LDZ6_9PSEU|nr:hypothetical protein [Amycolatopsis albispora]AXB46270.1 hypothetical protein A4R43_30580 [Amycolatopsis albispora]